MILKIQITQNLLQQLNLVKDGIKIKLKERKLAKLWNLPAANKNIEKKEGVEKLRYQMFVKHYLNDLLMFGEL